MFKQDKYIISALVVAALVCMIIFLTYQTQGKWSYVLTLRGTKIIGLVLIAIAIASSTIVFHTISHNRIITPSIMGFDALYIFIQTVLIFFLSVQEIQSISPTLRYFINLALMIAVFISLFYFLFLRSNRSIFLLALTGIVMGIFFRSMTNFMIRLLDPDSFSTIQGLLFSSFGSISNELLSISALLIFICLVIIYKVRFQLDILALGREKAIILGVNYKKLVFMLLTIIAILVSVSTALVGPITFFGLLVSNLAYLIIKNQNHVNLLVTACLIAIITLLVGQFTFEKLLELQGTLSVVIECLGGITFIWILLRTHKR
ncbi:MAG: enterobactin ABC transporter permease [Hyphomicrobiales bacterium]|nr:MAG: enterobactin ABC transporter permease [Hyphomicrobiales bacterium]